MNQMAAMTVPPQALRPFDTSVALGLDFGRHNDCTAASVVRGGCPMNLVYQAQAQGGSWDSHLHMIDGIINVYKPTVILVDGTGVGDALYERIPTARAAVIVGSGKYIDLTKRRFVVTQQALIGTLLQVINTQMLVVSTAAPELLQQLRQLAVRFSKARNQASFSARQGHDDEVFSLALAVFALLHLTAETSFGEDYAGAC